MKKMRYKPNSVSMSDDLGDIMYAANEDELQQKWAAYKVKWAYKKPFLRYFEREWMRRPGNKCFS
jgi:hypothetical protein